MAQLCPVCGYELDFRPWNGESSSDEICPSCGIQFGYDDSLADGRQSTYEAWRKRWIEDGMRWWSSRPEPACFDPVAQLERLRSRGPGDRSEVLSQDVALTGNEPSQ